MNAEICFLVLDSDDNYPFNFDKKDLEINAIKLISTELHQQNKLNLDYVI